LRSFGAEGAPQDDNSVGGGQILGRTLHALVVIQEIEIVRTLGAAVLRLYVYLEAWREA
jgi:hypothetical protein